MIATSADNKENNLPPPPPPLQQIISSRTKGSGIKETGTVVTRSSSRPKKNWMHRFLSVIPPKNILLSYFKIRVETNNYSPSTIYPYNNSVAVSQQTIIRRLRRLPLLYNNSVAVCLTTINRSPSTATIIRSQYHRNQWVDVAAIYRPLPY